MAKSSPFSLPALLQAFEGMNPQPNPNPKSLAPGNASLPDVKRALDELSQGVPSAPPAMAQASPELKHRLSYAQPMDLRAKALSQMSESAGMLPPADLEISAIPRRGQALSLIPEAAASELPPLDASSMHSGENVNMPLNPSPSFPSTAPYDPDEELRAIMQMRKEQTEQAKSLLNQAGGDPNNLWALLGAVGADSFNARAETRGQTPTTDKVIGQIYNQRNQALQNKLKALDYDVKNTDILAKLAQARMQQQMMTDRALGVQGLNQRGKESLAELKFAYDQALKSGDYAQQEKIQNLISERQKALQGSRDKSAMERAKIKAQGQTVSDVGKVTAKTAIGLGQSKEAMDKLFEVEDLIQKRQMGKVGGLINWVKSTFGVNDPELASDLAFISAQKFPVQTAAAGGHAVTEGIQKDVNQIYPHPGKDSHATTLAKVRATQAKMLADYEGKVQGLENVGSPLAIPHRQNLERLKSEYQRRIGGSAGVPDSSPHGKRVEQNGITYEWNGSQYVPLGG